MTDYEIDGNYDHQVDVEKLIESKKSLIMKQYEKAFQFALQGKFYDLAIYIDNNYLQSKNQAKLDVV